MASTSASGSGSSTSAVANSTTRLYVGNLHFTVDEYALIKIFSKYGKIAKLDFLFHKTGIMKGKPRGYAFVEFGSKEDALKALTTLHDKPLRGRNLVVTYASQAQTEPSTGYRPGGSGRGGYGGPQTDRRTTLSIVKGQRAPQGANAQIAALEAKLAEMKRAADPTLPPGPGPTPEERRKAGLPSKPTGAPTKVPDGEGMNGTA